MFMCIKIHLFKRKSRKSVNGLIKLACQTVSSTSPFISGFRHLDVLLDM